MAWPGAAPAHPRGSWNAQTAPNARGNSSKASPGAPWCGLETAWPPGTENPGLEALRESLKWNFMGEVSLAQGWNSDFVGKGSLGMPLLSSEFQGSGFLAAF